MVGYRRGERERTRLQVCDNHVIDMIKGKLNTPDRITALTTFLQGSGAFTFTGEKFTPRGTPSFEAEPEPPDIDSEDEESDSGQ